MKKIWKKRRIAGYAVSVLCLALLVMGVTWTAGMVMADDDSSEEDTSNCIEEGGKTYCYEGDFRDPNGNEKVYKGAGTSAHPGTNFSKAYSTGIAFRNELVDDASDPHRMTITAVGMNDDNNCTGRIGESNEGVDAYCDNNKEKVSSRYFKKENVAIYNNEYLDVREYVWIESGKEGYDGDNPYYYMSLDETERIGYPSPTGGLQPHNAAPGLITTEIHFYKHGTDTEVSFKGVMGFIDLDTNEGMTFVQGLHQAYVRDKGTAPYFENVNGTNLVYSAVEQGQWLGTGAVTNAGKTFWVEVESSSSRPLTIQYRIPSGHGLRANMEMVKVNYNLVGDTPSGVSAPDSDQVVFYGTMQPAAAGGADGWTFDGWYREASMTNKVSGDLSVEESDINLYGKYTKNATASITTSITYGTIDPNVADITPGTNKTIGYNCNPGYELSSITVDGSSVSTSSYPTSYTFSNIAAGNHTIAVVCRAEEEPPVEEKASVITDIDDGEITESNKDIEPGIDYTVEYECKSEKDPLSIKIDGEEVEVEDYPESYTFNRIEGDHTVKVTCSEEAEEEKSDIATPDTGRTTSSLDQSNGGVANIMPVLFISIVAISGLTFGVRTHNRRKINKFGK